MSLIDLRNAHFEYVRLFLVAIGCVSDSRHKFFQEGCGTDCADDVGWWRRNFVCCHNLSAAKTMALYKGLIYLLPFPIICSIHRWGRFQV